MGYSRRAPAADVTATTVFHWYNPKVHFTPLRPPLVLPTVGSSIERAVMDWKVRPAVHTFEKAKDVAAFANHLGGTLLIGAQEDDATGQLKAYVGLTQDESENVRDGYSKAIGQRCRPLPTFDLEEYEAPHDSAKRIVAINIWPSLNLVGVKVQANKAIEGWGETVYAYPVRSGTDAVFLQPTELAMYMTPEVRRNAVLLSRIEKDAPVNVIVLGTGHHFPAKFDLVDEESNLVRLKSGGGESVVHLPLDRLSTVYQNEKREWQLAMHTYRA